MQLTVIILAREYVQGLKDATQLLDLLSATGTDEATHVLSGGRGPLYPEVRFWVLLHVHNN